MWNQSNGVSLPRCCYSRCYDAGKNIRELDCGLCSYYCLSVYQHFCGYRLFGGNATSYVFSMTFHAPLPTMTIFGKVGLGQAVSAVFVFLYCTQLFGEMYHIFEVCVGLYIKDTSWWLVWLLHLGSGFLIVLR